MAITISDSDGGLGAIIRGEGRVEESELLAALKEHLFQDPEKFRRYRYSLSDYSEISELDLSTQAIETIANYCREASAVNPDAIVTIVAYRDFLYGLSRMWEAWLADTDWETMIFRTREEAEAWLRQRVEEKYGITSLTFS